MAGRGKQLEKIQTPFPSVFLVLFANSPYWWIRFWNKQKRQSFFRSTETVDKDRAMALVPEVYQEYLQNPDANRADEGITVPELIDRFVAHHEERVKRKEITARTWDAKQNSLKTGLLNYLIEFRLLRVKELNFRKDFVRYPSWRKALGYKTSSIKLEVKIIKEFANWCLKNGYIKDATCNIVVPRQTHEAKDDETNERAFSEEQITLIDNEFKRLREVSEGSERVKWTQVHLYFQLMLDGGFRTDELWHVEFRDIKSKSNRETLLDVRISKTGRRNTVFLTDTVSQLKILYESKNIDVVPSLSLWIDVGTQKMWTKQFFTRRFREVLTNLSIGLEFRLYCCRATHITRAIINQVSTYLLAKNLGTSEYMIHRHYEDILVEEQTKMLLQNTQQLHGFSYKDRVKDDEEFRQVV
jgi:integrase